jgi:DNA-binding SARP family transcriptional activator/DNA-binding beta-propeller fold protein YncE
LPLSTLTLTEISQVAHVWLTAKTSKFGLARCGQGANFGWPVGAVMRYRVLGPLEIEASGELLPIRGAKQRALLAILLMHANEVVSRDVLIEDLWGDAGPTASVHSLEVLISRLRKALYAGDSSLVTRPTGYELLVGAEELDLTQFERLCKVGRLALNSGAAEQAAEALTGALALWRGRPFEDIAYEPFAQIEIERLEERRLAALEGRIEADLALGRHADVVEELEALVTAHPLRERLRAQLMIALYRSGRQAEALRVYRDARRELVAELGIEPGDALRKLEQAILRHDPELEIVPVSSRTSDSKRAAQSPLKLRVAVRRRVLLLALVLGAVAAAVGAAVAVLSPGDPGLPGIDPDSVGVIDPRSGRIVAETPVGQRPTAVASDGGVWIANFDSGTLSHIDRQSREVVSVTNAGGTPTGLAVGDGAVWVSNGFANRLLRLDPRDGEVTATIPIDGHPGAIAVDRNGVWVANRIAGSVARIQPDLLQVTTIRVGGGPSGIAVGDGSVWVANALGRTLTEIDSTTARIVRRRIALRCAPAGVAFGAGSVWVTCTTANEVARLNPHTDQSTATIRVGSGPTGVAIVNGRVWVADTLDREISEIDPTRDAVVRNIPTGARPEGLAAVQRELWVTAHRN